MKKFIVLVLMVCFLFQTAFVEKVEARAKLFWGIGLTVAGVTGILVGRKDEDVLKKEYDFPTYAYVSVWDEINGVWITEWEEYLVDPHPETVVEESIITEGWAYGTNFYDIYAITVHNHHKEYKTEKRTNTVGYMGYVATGVGVTLIIDYLLEKTQFTKRTGLEIQTIVQPGYYNLSLAKRY